MTKHTTVDCEFKEGRLPDYDRWKNIASEPDRPETGAWTFSEAEVLLCRNDWIEGDPLAPQHFGLSGEERVSLVGEEPVMEEPDGATA